MRSEDTNQLMTRHRFAYTGPIWRNNSGAYQDDKSGRLVRYGLANESKQENEKIKSSDLIGITPELLFHPVRGWGQFGIFTALEIKPEGWKLTPGDKRGNAQLAFHDIVRNVGGYAGFVTDPENDIRRIIGR
jgi:hypothetical protein